jgi:transcriptional regulator with PAS, ATPase and Fis domain
MSDSEMLQPEDFILTPKKKKVADFEIDSFNLDEIEKNIIEKVLKQHQGNITQTATDLGLTRTSLYRRMEKYGL